jgi:signal transduction histidine kinase
MLCSNAIKFTHEGKVGINLYVVQEPTFTKAESIQKITSGHSTIPLNVVKEEKYGFNDDCRSPVKSECSMNGDTDDQHSSNETTVWICCDVYDTGIGIPGMYIWGLIFIILFV